MGRGDGRRDRKGGVRRRSSALAKRPDRYHHGDLRAALLAAAERILERDGLAGLTLRAAARETGVSHAAPKNHFGDLAGMLSDLAAAGFDRLAETMRAAVRDAAAPGAGMKAMGGGYVAFARRYPALFVLMFRGERLDMRRPGLRKSAMDAMQLLVGAVGERRGETVDATLTLEQAAQVAGAWSLVHGFALLLIDGRLQPLAARLPAGTDMDALLAAVLDPPSR
ncbi:MAG: WHG domain-containing protein [Alphaproteobacteria bacterium]|nr:WHG domain-containing protein [Alphaproteobacteria bacterium]